MLPLEHVTGINYWFPEEAGNGDKGTVISTWLNRGFWNEDKSTTGHEINRNRESYANALVPPENVSAPYYMGKFAGQTQDIEHVTDPATNSHKVIRNGQLLIERNGIFYNAQGIPVKE